MNNLALPPELADRRALHDEIHARPSTLVHAPSRILYIAVDTSQTPREEEVRHVGRLLGTPEDTADRLDSTFWAGTVDGCTASWERHTEFSRYILTQPLTGPITVSSPPFAALDGCPMSASWRSGIPGEVFCAIEMIILTADMSRPTETLAEARTWWGEQPIVASILGNQGHSLAVTDLKIGVDGFERFLVLTSGDASAERVGRLASRLLDLETYRLMALRGLPVAKSLAPVAKSAESELAAFTLQLEERTTNDRELLTSIIALASTIERATSAHAYRFAATSAYNAIVEQRLAELHEKPVAGTIMLGDFLRRRFSPAIATVASMAERLQSRCDRIAHTGSLLRPRVDIASEEQNQQLLARLTRGQALQLQLQSTVEGLSIAAVSYYVVGLIALVAKGAHAAGLPVQPELVAGASVPFVVFAVWQFIRRIHRRLKVS